MSERTNGMLKQFSDAPTLLMVHGGQDHARNWDWLTRALRSDWHVVARTCAAIPRPSRRAIPRSMACRRMRSQLQLEIRQLYTAHFSMCDRHALQHAIGCPILILHGENSWLPDPRTDGSLEHFRARDVVRTRRPFGASRSVRRRADRIS